MLDPKIIATLREHAARLKELLPATNGSVTFHLSARPQEPQIEVRLCNVTGGKKTR